METTIYNVYQVYFHQTSGRDHEGIALVPAQNACQTAGRFYHVKGLVGMGMDYERQPGCRFGDRDDFKEAVYQFQIPRSLLGRFEEVAGGVEPPFDSRALMGRPDALDALDVPVRNCSSWVEEVLREIRVASRGDQSLVDLEM